MSELVKALTKKNKVDWDNHEPRKPSPPIGTYDPGMVLLDFLVEVPEPFYCRMYVVNPYTPLQVMALFALQGEDDSTLLEQCLYPVARYAKCLKNHYFTDPFPMFYLTEDTYKRAWFYHQSPAIRTMYQNRVQLQFRCKLPAAPEPYIISDQTRQACETLSKRLAKQGAYYKKMSTKWFF